MRDIHNILMTMLVEIDRICKKYDITYYAAGGTVIGAARHGGFIPWDDDADIYMTRDDFYRFREAFKKEQPENRVLECIEDNPDYPGTIPRYIDISATHLARFDVLNNCAAGVVIDIFILDPIPSDPELQRKQRNYLNVYSDVVMPIYGFSHRNDLDYLDVYFDYHDRVKKEGKHKVAAELAEMLFTYPEEEAEYYMLRWGTLPNIFPKKMMGKPVYMDYEGYSLPMPEQWYDYLVQLYGNDWYQVPDYVEDEGHNAVTNYTKPYQLYYDDAFNYIDVEQLDYELYTRKKILLERRILTKDFYFEEQDVHCRFVKSKLDQDLEKTGCSLKELFDNGEYDKIMELMNEYLFIQLSLQFVGALRHSHIYMYNNPKIINLTDEQFYYFFNTLLIKGRIRQLSTFRRVIPSHIRELPMTKHFFDALYKVFEIIKAYNTGEYERALEVMETLDDFYKENVFVVRLIKYNILFDTNAPELNTDELKSFCENNAGEADVLYLLAKIYEREGDKEKAEELSKEVYQTSNNGLILNEIEKKYDFDIPPSYEIPRPPYDSTKPKTPEGETMLTLLKEFVSICRENNIDYSPEGRTLLYAKQFGIFPKENRPISFMMTPENAEKFVEATKDLTGRYQIEYQENSDNYTAHSIYFCDMETTFINMRSKMRTNIHIVIKILKRRSDSMVRAIKTRGYEILEYMAASNLTTNKKRYIAAKSITSGLINGSGKSKFKSKVYTRQIEDAKNGSGDYYLSYNKMRQQAKYYLPARLFEKYSTVSVYGTEIKCVEDIESLVKITHHKFVFDTLKIRPDQFTIHIINDTKNKLEDTVENLKLDYVLDESRDKWEKGIRYNNVIRKGNKTLNKAFNVMKRTDARILLAEELVPQKEEIIRLFNEGKYDEVREILYNYEVAVNTFKNRKMAIYFDEDIYEIFIQLLTMYGEEDMVEAIKENIEREGLMPLDKNIVDKLL